MVNIIVAFGITEDSYFIASGGQTYRNQLPTRMEEAVASASIDAPYTFASIGHGGRFFISGTNTPPLYEAGAKGAITCLETYSRSTTGMTFGDSGAWAWLGKPNVDWYTGNLATSATSWINKWKRNDGRELRPILGVGGAVVLLYSNGKTPNTNCAQNVQDMLHAAEDKGVHIRYLALSPNNRDWFFVQFEDGSITWHTTGTHGATISRHLRELAKRDNLKVRLVSTLAFEKP